MISLIHVHQDCKGGTAVILAVFLSVLAGCTGTKPETGKEEYSLTRLLDKHGVVMQAKDNPSTQTLDIAKQLSEEASLPELEKTLRQEILPEIRRSSRRDLPVIREAIARLGGQPQIVQALVNIYDSVPIDDTRQRYLIVQLLGELQRPDSYEFLHAIVWRPLLAPEGLSSAAAEIRQRNEEMIKVKGVHSIAYLRDEEERLHNEAVDETLKIMLDHPSRIVRIAAIDAYMWNRNDSNKAAADLYSILPPEYHMYVERPRFHRGMNRDVFNKRLESWRGKWAQSEPR